MPAVRGFEWLVGLKEARIALQMCGIPFARHTRLIAHHLHPSRSLA